MGRGPWKDLGHFLFLKMAQFPDSDKRILGGQSCGQQLVDELLVIVLDLRYKSTTRRYRQSETFNK